jgi:tRNA (guanine-N7-)-methyltransferase
VGRGKKLERFAQIKIFQNVFEPDGKKILMEDFSLKGKWSQEYFKNNNPITLELGCGKGEYTVGVRIFFDQ